MATIPHCTPTNYIFSSSHLSKNTTMSHHAANPGSSNESSGSADSNKTLRRSLGSQPLQYRPFSARQMWLYDFIMWMFLVIFDCFFREIRPRGAFRLPKKGAVIFVAAPHANQFVDPMILMNQVKREAGRRVSFLIAQKSYKHSVIGPLSRAQLSIPVQRAQDMLQAGTGKIYLDFEKNPLLVTGEGTKFTHECMHRGLLALPKSLGAVEIDEIISDTKLTLRKEFTRSDTIVKLLSKGTPFKVADKIDQKQVYQYVFDHLSAGNCVGIFPEGGSHDRTDLLPLKAGVAIMALGAMTNDPDCNVKIVPCGMNYFNAHKFRSRAVVEFGHPIEFLRDLVDKYNDPATHKQSISECLEIITNGLRAVTVNCQDYETLMVVQAARRLYAGNFAQYLPLPMVVEMNRRLVLGYETFKDQPDLKRLKSKILHYNELLKINHLPDHHVEDCDVSHKLNLIPILVFRIMKLIFFVILALPGAILFSPVFAISKHVSKKKAETALANSTVKVKANDVVATWKILISMGAAPVLYSFYASIGTWYCKRKSYLSSYGLISIWFILYMLGVLVTYSALITGEQGLDLLKSIRPVYLSIFSGASITKLKELRRELSEEITEFVNRYGLELFPDDFNLLEIKDYKEPVQKEMDSDEEEEFKTQQMRNRRTAVKKERAARKAALQSVAESAKASDSDSSSIVESVPLRNTQSYTNIPMFSDYDLHMNEKNSQVDLKSVGSSALPSALQSALPSSSSIIDDFDHQKSLSGHELSQESSDFELNFGALKDEKNISSKIQSKIRQSRGSQ